MSNIHRKNKESWNNYNDRVTLNEKYNQELGGYNRYKIFDSTDRYKRFLEENNIPYVEGELEKKNGKLIHWVIPQCQFKNLSKTEVNKLFKI